MDQLGPYELLEQIGRGGMGAVFRARDSRDGRPVAIKLLHGGGAANQTWRKRFVREAAALARVQHPHVVRAVGFDSAPSGEPYLVMEWVAGESLQDRLDRGGALSPAEAVALAITLCEALAACHAAGILHRDLKPANVLVDRERGLKLTDFGLVRDTDPSTSRSALTRTGNMLGSPGYWAPEQALGQLERVGPATDVYGAGALLFGLLTTRPPQHGESLIEILRRATEPAPAPSSPPRRPRA